jgi:hypothetical protein
LTTLTLRVLAHEVLDLRFRAGVERIVGRPHVGELRTS